MWDNLGRRVAGVVKDLEAGLIGLGEGLKAGLVRLPHPALAGVGADAVGSVAMDQDGNKRK